MLEGSIRHFLLWDLNLRPFEGTFVLQDTLKLQNGFHVWLASEGLRFRAFRLWLPELAGFRVWGLGPCKGLSRLVVQVRSKYTALEVSCCKKSIDPTPVAETFQVCGTEGFRGIRVRVFRAGLGLSESTSTITLEHVLCIAVLFGRGCLWWRSTRNKTAV